MGPQVGAPQARRVISASLAVRIGGLTRVEAAQALGYGNAPKAARSFSATLEAIDRARHMDDYGDAITELALALDAKPKSLVDYADRRERFEDFDLIPDGDYDDLCTTVGRAAGSDARRRSASAWLWEYLTGNDARDSRALTQHNNPVNAREMWRRCR